MNWQSWLFWGVMATLAQATFESITQALHLTRMSLPFMLGTMVTSARSKARLWGFGLHIVSGLLFALPYIVAFHFLGGPSWWRGALFGAVQGTIVLTLGMSLMPNLHPRMATEWAGPSATRRLEPPGFFALNYGAKTPIAVLLSHVIFGTVLGSFCNA
ncbi:SAM-dependent methyltransferase [Tunturibacter empetritectus]|uniref:Uncharacterized protein n=1 Tax=Tunturiibacter lichenicola TaxID=2051959 RepID=A0A7W8N4I9_9BACT|nr:hypothetical protein [Edaphobacter lichenicola]MBB5342980.1 hypothetical protein [Edaphobacter lichenicola]